jgi:hypothetical protein
LRVGQRGRCLLFNDANVARGRSHGDPPLRVKGRMYRK